MSAFTNAELAAETYRQMTRAIAECGMATDGEQIAPTDAMVVVGPVRRETARLGTMKRFATLHHAAAENYL